MASSRLTGEERIGLLLAVMLHGGLLAAILLRPPPSPLSPPERIEVTLSADVAPVSRAPEQASDAAPEAGEPAPDAAATEPEPAPPAPRAAEPQPPPRPQAKPQPQPQTQPMPRPTARPLPKPTAQPVTRTAPKPAAKPAAKPSATRPATRPAAATRSATPATRPGASRIGDDFLNGAPGARATGPARLAAAEIGADARSSLLGGISRELRPHWQGKAPEGADSEKLVTVLRWSMNPDGTLAGAPQVVRQEGITEANRPQAARHGEQAIRAVQLAAPFALDETYYEAWKRVTIRFDKRLSQ